MAYYLTQWPSPYVMHEAEGGALMEYPETKRSFDLLDVYTKAGVFLPKTLTVAITNRCNLHCVHCWPDSQQLPCIQPVPARDVVRIIEKFVEIAGDRVCITGGEPLIHPDWHKILTYACEHPGKSSWESRLVSGQPGISMTPDCPIPYRNNFSPKQLEGLG